MMDGLSFHRVAERSCRQAGGVHQVAFGTCRPGVTHSHWLRHFWRGHPHSCPLNCGFCGLENSVVTGDYKPGNCTAGSRSTPGARRGIKSNRTAAIINRPCGEVNQAARMSLGEVASQLDHKWGCVRSLVPPREAIRLAWESRGPATTGGS
jgi:hypothetical protein